MERDPKQIHDNVSGEPADAGEFTRIFGSLQQPTPTGQAEPPASQQAEKSPSGDAGFTAMFAAQPTSATSVELPSTAAAQPLATTPSVLTTQCVADDASPTPGSLTALFSAPQTASGSSAVPQTRPVPHSPVPTAFTDAAALSSGAAVESGPVARPSRGGIFSQLSPVSPDAATQIFAAVPPAAAVAPSSDEETRIFPASASPFSPAAQNTAPSPLAAQHPVPAEAATPSPAQAAATPVQRPVPPPVIPAPAAAGEFTQIFRPMSPPTMKTPPPSAPAPTPPSGEFTQFFSAVSAQAASSKAPTPPVPPPAPVQQPVRLMPPEQPGAFTQLFSQASRDTGAPSQDEWVMPGQKQAAGKSAPSPSSLGSQPVFGTLGRQGTFSERPAPQAASPQPAVAASGGLTQLFSGAALPSIPSAPDVLPPPSASRGIAASHPGYAAAPPQAAVPQAGEFTRLMQSLDGSSAKPKQPAPAAPLPNAEFFAAPHGSAGEGEYTRVMRGGSASYPSSSAPASSASGKADAPGLALAPAAAAPIAGKEPAKEKPKLFVVLLVVANVVLLMALLVVLIYFLKHR